MCDVYGKVCFSQKMFANGLNMGLSLWVRIEKTVHGVKAHWHSGKEKVPSAAISKEGYADSLLGH